MYGDPSWRVTSHLTDLPLRRQPSNTLIGHVLREVTVFLNALNVFLTRLRLLGLTSVLEVLVDNTEVAVTEVLCLAKDIIEG